MSMDKHEITITPKNSPTFNLKGTNSIIIDISGDKVMIRKFVDGHIDESYRPLTKEEACIVTDALIQGFEPLPYLLNRGGDFD